MKARKQGDIKRIVIYYLCLSIVCLGAIHCLSAPASAKVIQKNIGAVQYQLDQDMQNNISTHSRELEVICGSGNDDVFLVMLLGAAGAGLVLSALLSGG